jgi:prepilin-type processing-associated H-X9-DG protein
MWPADTSMGALVSAGGAGPAKLDRTLAASRIFLFADVLKYTMTGALELEGQLMKGASSFSISADGLGSLGNRFADRHNRGTSIAHADGHVASYKEAFQQFQGPPSNSAEMNRTHFKPYDGL